MLLEEEFCFLVPDVVRQAVAAATAQGSSDQTVGKGVASRGGGCGGAGDNTGPIASHPDVAVGCVELLEELQRGNLSRVPVDDDEDDDDGVVLGGDKRGSGSASAGIRLTAEESLSLSAAIGAMVDAEPTLLLSSPGLEARVAALLTSPGALVTLAKVKATPPGGGTPSKRRLKAEQAELLAKEQTSPSKTTKSSSARRQSRTPAGGEPLVESGGSGPKKGGTPVTGEDARLGGKGNAFTSKASAGKSGCRKKRKKAG